MNLSEIRQHLDRLDTILVTVLAERMSLIPEVAEEKRKHNEPILQEARKREILEKRQQLAKELNLNPEFVAHLYEDIIDESMRIEREILEKK